MQEKSNNHSVFLFSGIFKALKQKVQEQKHSESLKVEAQDFSNANPTNPFLQENETQKYSKLDVAMDALTAFTVKRNLSMFILL